MWWLIGSAPDYCGSGPGFESGIAHSCNNSVYTVKSLGSEGNHPLRPKKEGGKKLLSTVKK